MTFPRTKPRVGILALTLELYETLAPQLKSEREQWMQKAILPALAPIADVQFERAVCRCDEVEATVRRWETDQLDTLLVICLTYAPSQIVLPALCRTRLPILIWNTQELFAVGPDFGPDDLLTNQGVHGTQDLANVLVRTGVPFEYVTSHVGDEHGLDRVQDGLVAASAVRALQRARLGLLGYPFPGMGDLALDTTHLAASLGCHWTTLAVEEYLRGAAAAPAGATERLVDEYRQCYRVADDVTDEDLEATARAELSLREIVARERLDALSYQFLAFGEDERSVTLPFVAASRLMAEGIGFAGEGDLTGAAGTWLLDRIQPPATFSEVFTVDFGGNALVMSHMGEANVAMAPPGQKVPLVARPKKITRTRGRQLALVTTVQPGPATLFALTQGPRQRWRLIASRMRIAAFGPLPSMAVPHFKLMPENDDVRSWLTRYAVAGGPHHNAVCFGDATPRIRLAAKFLDAEYCEV